MSGVYAENWRDIANLRVPIFEPVPLSDTVRDWPIYEPWLAAAVARSPMEDDTLTDIGLSIANGSATLHKGSVGKQAMAASVTKVLCRKDGNWLHVWLLGGDDMRVWLPEYLDYLDNWAALMGCKGVTFAGRKGWSRTLREHGYITDYVAMRREL